MLREQEQGVLVFLSYAHQDKKLRDKLENHLTDLKYRGLITTWSDREIRAGEVWRRQINVVANKAQIILFLVSADFLASDYCSGVEMKSAVERHARKEAEVIPILLRPVLYESAPFAKLAVLPKNGKPVTLWRSRDLAFVDIAYGIAEVAQKRLQPPPIRPIDPASSEDVRGLSSLGSLPEESSTLGCSGYAFLFVTLYLIVFGVLTLLRGVDFVASLGLLLPLPVSLFFLVVFLAKLMLQKRMRKRRYYEEAVQAYQNALAQNAHDGTAFRGMGNALFALKRYQEALSAFQQAVLYNPVPAAYAGWGDTFTKLKRYREAVAAYEQAMALDPTVTLDDDGFIQTLRALGRTEEVQLIQSRAKQAEDKKR